MVYWSNEETRLVGAYLEKNAHLTEGISEELHRLAPQPDQNIGREILDQLGGWLEEQLGARLMNVEGTLEEGLCRAAFSRVNWLDIIIWMIATARSRNP